jgi:uncharacterized Ntn-hydrolase superfamily protein
VAFDAVTRSWGVAVASACVAVGAAVAFGGAEVGVIATQATANLRYGPDGLALLRRGRSATEVVDRLTADDPRAEHRQLAVVDAGGDVANHTGSGCLAWAGHRTGPGFAVQGNLLAGEHVIDAMVAGYDLAQPHLGERLLACLVAGREAGGDRRGLESAALSVWQEGAAFGGGLDIGTDLRVDDHPEPIRELARLLGLHHLHFERPDPATLIPLTGALEAEVRAALLAVGYDAETMGGLDAAFGEWSGLNDYEERTVPGRLDPLIWEILRGQAREVGAP